MNRLKNGNRILADLYLVMRINSVKHDILTYIVANREKIVESVKQPFYIGITVDVEFFVLKIVRKAITSDFKQLRAVVICMNVCDK